MQIFIEIKAFLNFGTKWGITGGTGLIVLWGIFCWQILVEY